jgi:membrane protease YdiL (CAAX protease family)
VYFVAALALVTAGFVGDWTLVASGQPFESAAGFAALKLGEDLAIIVTVLVLILLIRNRLGSVFISKGRVRVGLVVGLSSFVGLTVLGLAFTAMGGIPWDRVFDLLPIFGAVVIADGIMEELLFRGLFLKRLARFVGPTWANVVTAAVFSLAHLQVEFAPSVPVFLVVVFSLGLLWGWLMQKTGSLIAPVLFHAGADMLIVANAFSAFGVQT